MRQIAFMRPVTFLRPGQTAVLLVASLATALSGSDGPLRHPASLVNQARTAIADAISGPQFTDAAFSLEQYRSVAGTYDDSAVQARGITVRWATTRLYCIEGVSSDGSAEYLLGPNGHVIVGRCPTVF